MLESIAIMLALLLAALVLMFLEVLTPSFGLLGAAAFGCMVGAVYFAFSVNGVVGVVLICVLLIGVPLYLVYMVKRLPTSRFGRKLILKEVISEPGEGTPDRESLRAYVGREGTAETPLRPSGAIRIDGHRVHALAEGGWVPGGSTVKVIRASGTEVVVRLVEPEKSAAAEGN